MTDRDIFSQTVEILKRSGIAVNDLSHTLNLYSDSNKLSPSLLAKLCKGNLKSYKGVSISEMNSILRKKYKIEDQRTINIQGVESAYLLYFWNRHNKLDYSVLLLSPSQLSKGQLLYLSHRDKEHFSVHSSIEVKSLHVKDSETMDIILKDSKHSGYTYITAFKGNRTIDELEQCFCSYSGSTENIQQPFAGIGLLRKVDPMKLEEVILNQKKNIPYRYYNALYRRRLDISGEEIKVYTKDDKLIRSNYDQLIMLRGKWQGYYLRNTIEGGEESGGMVHFIMDIAPSGYTRIFYHIHPRIPLNDKSDLIRYKGMIKFPIPHQSTIIHAEFEHKNNTPRIQMFLRYDNTYLKGIICGWRALDNSYFASPVVLQRLPSSIENQPDDYFIQTFRPAEYHHSDPHIGNLQTLFPIFGKIELDTFSNLESSLKKKFYKETEHYEFVLFRSKKKKTGEFRYIGICEKEPRKISMTPNLISFELLDKQEEYNLRNDFIKTPISFKISIKRLDEILFHYLAVKDYGITINKSNKTVVIHCNTHTDSIYKEVTLDNKEQLESDKKLHDELFRFFDQYFVITELK